MLVRVGTRGSELALEQTRETLERFTTLFPFLTFEQVVLETPGDRDLALDLREAPADFFTRDLDQALLDGRIEMAVHSAKDLPESPKAGVEWFWLPWREDARDAWVLRAGCKLSELEPQAVVGVSSERRAAYALEVLPQARLKKVRGAIPQRLAQLDAGDYDALLVAGAALKRLKLEERVTQWIDLDETAVPEGQGVLAVTFKKDNAVMARVRDYFVKAVRFVGAGVGSQDYCTWGGIKELRQAEVCLYDILMDERLLEFLPPQAQRVFVGKRCGEHYLRQPVITGMIARYVRQGKRVVRLKGGDPGLFGRLSEECDELEALGLPYSVRTGVSALTVATTNTGLLLTKRGVSRGFTAMTPRAAEGEVPGVALAARTRLPMALFMSVRVGAEVAQQLLAEGWAATTPVALVFNAGADEELVERTTLKGLCERQNTPAPVNAAYGGDGMPPGLIVIGAAGSGFRRDLGALRGCRVLLTCSEALQERTATCVVDFGGVPLARPMIKLKPTSAAAEAVARVAEYDWLTLTSPAAVRIFMELAREVGVDWRRLPLIMACGTGSAATFAEYGFKPDLVPPLEYSSAGLVEAMRELELSGSRVLRLRSEKAGPMLAEALSERGAVVDDVQLYTNEAVSYERLPASDAVFLASASAVDALVAQMGQETLRGQVVVAIGKPTMIRLLELGYTPDVVASEATAVGAIEALARSWIWHCQ